MPFLGNFDPRAFLMTLLALVIAISIHEFAHALAAYALGDDMAKREGRLTLNPVSHFDPLGFFMLLLLALFGRGFAWGRPVPVNTYALRGGRHGMALVAFAGPLSNLVQASVAVAVVHAVGAMPNANPLLLEFIGLYARFNVLLAAFNMLPIFPLDGFNVLMGLVSDFWVQRLAKVAQYGGPALLILVFIGGGVAYRYAIDPLASLFGRIVGF